MWIVPFDLKVADVSIFQEYFISYYTLSAKFGKYNMLCTSIWTWK